VQTSLPIWQIHSEIVGTLRQGNRLVLVAPTGSGKTTQVPQMLLEAGLAGERRIVVLQPRRVAARTVAARVAWERNGKLGDSGLPDPFRGSDRSRHPHLFRDRGILLRWLQDDLALSDVSVLLFDEFHERNLMSDVALALAKQLQRTTRPDLKLAVMSATLEATPVANASMIARSCLRRTKLPSKFIISTTPMNAPRRIRPRTPSSASSMRASRATSSSSCRAWARSTPP
jgi:ATP-dependent helicase HrpB